MRRSVPFFFQQESNRGTTEEDDSGLAMQGKFIGAILGECFRVLGFGSRSIVGDEEEN